MAEELTLGASFTFAKSGTELSLSVGALKVDVSGNGAIQQRQSVGFAAEEALILGDVTTVGYCIMVNRDATNFVEVRPATGVADLIRLNAGEFAVFRFAATATAPFVIADTAAVEIEYVLLEA
jgi:hypothetical protein